MRKMKFGILLVFAVLALVSVASALPTQAVGSITHPGPSSYWDVDIVSTTPGGDLDLPVAPDYVGWCADVGTGIDPINNPFTFDVYSSLVPPSQVPAIPTANWKNINWVLNNKGGYNWKTIQMVIWHFDGQSSEPYPWHSSMGTLTQALKDEYDTLKPVADTHGAFTPSCRDKYAIILYDVTKAQPIFVEGTTTCTETPEFPNLALPVGMMVGLIGAVYVIKGREK